MNDPLHEATPRTGIRGFLAKKPVYIMFVLSVVIVGIIAVAGWYLRHRELGIG